MKVIHRLFREHAIRAVERLSPGGDLPLQLSGGVDSATVLAAQLALGARPACYTWTAGDHDSRDVLVSADMCRAFGLEHHVVRVPVSRSQLVADIRAMARICREADPPEPLRETSIQGAHPHLYLMPLMADHGHRESLWGWMSAWYGEPKHDKINIRRWGEAWFSAHRRSLLLDSDDPRGGGSVRVCDLIAARHGHAQHTPYLDREWCEYLLSLPLRRLHEPFQKAIAVLAFPEFWGAGRWYRANEESQVVAGIKLLHETLLKSPHNRRGSSRMLSVYHDIAREA